MTKRTSDFVTRIPARTHKAVQDTAEGCRAYAAADTARAALMDTENGRRRLELSASTWLTRSHVLQRLDDSYLARQAMARAEWTHGETAGIQSARVERPA